MSNNIKLTLMIAFGALVIVLATSFIWSGCGSAVSATTTTAASLSTSTSVPVLATNSTTTSTTTTTTTTTTTSTTTTTASGYAVVGTITDYYGPGGVAVFVTSDIQTMPDSYLDSYPDSDGSTFTYNVTLPAEGIYYVFAHDNAAIVGGQGLAGNNIGAFGWTGTASIERDAATAQLQASAVSFEVLTGVTTKDFTMHEVYVGGGAVGANITIISTLPADSNSTKLYCALFLDSDLSDISNIDGVATPKAEDNKTGLTAGETETFSLEDVSNNNNYAIVVADYEFAAGVQPVAGNYIGVYGWTGNNTIAVSAVYQEDSDLFRDIEFFAFSGSALDKGVIDLHKIQ